MLQSLSLSASLSKFIKPRCRLISSPTKYILEYELPGVPKDEIDVACDSGSILTVKATKPDNKSTNAKIIRNERHFGQFERKIRLPQDAQVADIDANLSLGVLTITVPRTTNQDKERISITVN